MNEKKLEELKADEGREISEEQLDAIAGGGFTAVADYDDENGVARIKAPNNNPNDQTSNQDPADQLPKIPSTNKLPF